MTLDEVLNQAVEGIRILAIGRMSDTLHLDMSTVQPAISGPKPPP